MTSEENYFRLCSTCKKPLQFGQPYYACSVSTCNRKRTFLTFCSVNCWQAHLPIMRHRDAWAEEKRAPTRQQYEKEKAEEAKAEQTAARKPKTKPVDESKVNTMPGEPYEIELNDKDIPKDILIVASKLKQYIRARSGMNTSESVLQKLSGIVRQLTDQAIEKAAKDGRKTVMDRDY